MNDSSDPKQVPPIKVKSEKQMLQQFWRILLFAFLLLAFCVIPLLIYPAIRDAQNSASRKQSRMNLKTIGQAILHYEEEHFHFPESSIKDESGKPLLSWRVELLPYLGYQELYDQFDLTQPWNSETNKQLISRMPELFQCPDMDSGEFKTNYLLVLGKETIFPPERATQEEEIIDGTGYTIMAVEANPDQAVIWTQPGDLNFNPEDPMQGLFSMRNGLGLFLMADGSVEIFDKRIDKKYLKGMMTKAGKEFTILGGEIFGI